MKKITASAKLSLVRQSLRQLSGPELERAAGGLPQTWSDWCQPRPPSKEADTVTPSVCNTIPLSPMK